MNQQDQQAIEELFKHLYQTAAQAGPRDGAAEALIQRYVQQAPPGLIYQMAQTLVAQQYTLNQLRAQLAADQRQGGAPAGFAPPQGGRYQRHTGSRSTSSRARTSSPGGSGRGDREAASWPGQASSLSGSAAAFSAPRC